MFLGIDVCLKSKVSGNILGKFYLLLGQGLCGRQNYDTAISAIEKVICIILYLSEIYCMCYIDVKLCIYL